MGGGNAQKAKMAREKNLEKAKGAKGMYINYESEFSWIVLLPDSWLCDRSYGSGSQLEANKKAMSIQVSSDLSPSLDYIKIVFLGVNVLLTC